MLNFLRRFASRFINQEPLGERAHNASHGPLLRMLERDLSNLDRLTRALAEHRM